MATRKSKKSSVKSEVKTQLEVKPTEPTSVPESIPPDEVKIKARSTRSDRGAVILGGSLLVVGALLLLGQFLRIQLGDYLWPFIFIIPGVIIFVSALNMEGGGDGLAIVGGILATLGGLFLVQSLTDFWASWAYAWSLVAPTSIGLSQWIFGTVKRNDSMVSHGQQLVKVGLTIFAIGFIFFELVLGIDGFSLTRFGLPALPIALIVVGVFILLQALLVKKG